MFKKKLAEFYFTKEDIDLAIKDEGINPENISHEVKEFIAVRAMDYITEDCHKAVRDAIATTMSELT